MSNIRDVFFPPPARDIPEQEIEDCIPCNTVQALVAMGGGLWLASENQFRDKSTGKIDAVKNPLWWRRSVRGLGLTLFVLGTYRAFEVSQAIYHGQSKTT